MRLHGRVFGAKGGPMSTFLARFGKIEFWLGYLLAFALGLALGGTIIASFPTAAGLSGLRYVQSDVRSDRPRFAFATKVVVQTDKLVGAPFEVTRARRDLTESGFPNQGRCDSESMLEEEASMDDGSLFD
jgi:hypothetical protein